MSFHFLLRDNGNFSFRKFSYTFPLFDQGLWNLTIFFSVFGPKIFPFPSFISIVGCLKIDLERVLNHSPRNAERIMHTRDVLWSSLLHAASTLSIFLFAFFVSALAIAFTWHRKKRFSHFLRQISFFIEFSLIFFS